MKLKDLSTNIFSGGTPSTTNEEFWNGDFCWLSSGETKNTYIKETEKTITKLGIEKSSTRLAKIGDVVIASAGQGKTRGQVAYCLIDTYINQSVIAIRVKKELLNSKYLFYNLSSRYNELRLLSDSSSSRGSLTVKTFEELDIKTPNIKKQDKIAKVLSNYDDLIENNNRRIKILEEMAQKIYKEWFVDFKFPGHETATFKQTDVGSEVMPKKGKNITKATIKEGNVPVVAGGIEPAYYHNVPNTVAPVITVSASGANAGYINLYYQDIWASDCSYIDKTMTPYVYYYYLLLKYNQTKVTNMQRGAAQPHVYPQDLAQLKIKIPEERIIEKFNDIITPFFKEISNLSLKNQTLKQTRDILLPGLISGEIDVENMEIK